MTGSLPKGESALDRVSVFLATGLYLSLFPLKLFRTIPVVRNHATDKWSGCGLMGSIEGVATYLLLPEPWASSPVLLVAAVLFSVAVSSRAERVIGVHDDTRIVIDEWVGAWIACAGAPHAWGWSLLAAFVLFRFFDVVKGPLGRLQNLPRGWGVTLDDVAAGLLSAVLLQLAARF